MDLLVTGLNHKTAPVEVREKAYVCEDDVTTIFKALAERGVPEYIVISTCNRTEVYAGFHAFDETRRSLDEALMEHFHVGREWLKTYTYTFSGEECYSHLFFVVSGLDSMVIGEPQILGQVKDSFRAARDAGGTGPFLEKIFNRAFHVAKRVRTETKIGYNPVSISSMAVELARKIFGDLSRKRILVVGAGEMCETALQRFRKEGLSQIVVTNRTFRRAEQLAEEVIGTPAPFEELPDLLTRVDMVLSSTGAPQPIIDRQMIGQAMRRRKGRALFLIDIAVPRDVEAAVNEEDNVYLYNIDDLKGLSEERLADRGQEAQRAQAIIRDEVARLGQWLKRLELDPFITHILGQVEEIRQKELKRGLQKLHGSDEAAAKQMDLVTRALVNKIIHPHIEMIKSNGSPLLLDIMKQLFSYGDEHEDVDTGDQGQ